MSHQQIITSCGDQFGTGWVDDQAAVWATVRAIEAQGVPALFEDAAPHLIAAADDDAPVFFWEAEKRLLGKVLPSWNQRSVGSCFPPGTLVRTADGRNKPIDRLFLLEEVVTAEGRTGKVTSLFSRRHKGELCTLVLWGHGHLKATPEHPVLTRRGYVPVGELTAEDWVAMPRYAAQRAAVVVPADHVDERVRKYARNGGERTFSGVNGRKATTVTYNPLPDAIPLDVDAGLIFGLFLAEGSTDRSKVVWTFSRAERDTLVAQLVATLKRGWAVDARVQERPGRAGGSLKVVVYGTAWARLFESLCSTGAGEKQLHPDLSGGPAEFLRAMFEGWMSGDGYAGRRAERVGVSVSHELALSMFDVAQSLGMNPTIRRSQPKPSHGVKTRRERWDVTVRDSGEGRGERDDTHVWRKVRWVNREDFEGWVYNCEVEGDNSYVAEGIGVHNCVGFGNGRAGQDILLWEVAAGEPEQWPGAEICPEIIYGGSRVEVGGGRISGDGSIGAWAAKWVKDWGLVPRGVYGNLDVTTYNESTCRQLGRNGIPAEVETAARLHPVTAVAMVRSGDDWWAGTGAGKPSAICSGRGFTTTLKKGFCQPSGSWAHCMEGRGRFRRAGDKEKCGVIQNSWGGYLSIPSQDDKFIDVWTPTGDIRVELPEGCFATTLDVIDRMLGEQDSFFFAGLKGWEAVRLDYTP
jgi:hypothetical protein